MITNAQPWDNLKFDLNGVAEVQRKFFGTLHNTYAFFALYANIDGFDYSEDEIPVKNRPEIDQWIISELNTLIKNIDEYLGDYEPTKAARAIQDFVNDHLSNWYVRLSRRKFWKGNYSDEKIAAYQTLYKCLEVVAQLSSPVAPFFMDNLFRDLNNISNKQKVESVHLTDFPKIDESCIDKDLEERMQLAQKYSSMILSLRKKSNIRVRQPLNKIMIPVSSEKFKAQVEAVKELILSEVNVKEIEYLSDDSNVLVKKIKPNFKTLGPKYGRLMKQIAVQVNQFSGEDIVKLEQDGQYTLEINGEEIEILLSDVEISTEDIPGWLIANMGILSVALDITITDALKQEGIARELINRIQNIRKDKNFEVTDKIDVEVLEHDEINLAVTNNISYICTEILAVSLNLVKELDEKDVISVDLIDNIKTQIYIKKH